MSDNPRPLEMNSTQVRPPVNAGLWVQCAALAGLFLLIFGTTMPALYHDWRTFDTFSHGLLVPFISAYLVWQKKAELLALPIRSSAWGATLIFLAVILAIAGAAVGDSFTERVGMVLCMAGLVWTLFGSRIFKHLAFPVAYLFLMIPLPYVVVKEVAYQLRIVDAALAAPVLRMLGVPVYREAYYLHLPDITLEVADLCSGISSVFALLALGAAYVYLLPLRPRWKTLAVISTFPFAAFINLLRIVLTAALTYHVSPAVLGVLVHQMTGTITFFIALFLFIALVEILLRRFGRRQDAKVQPAGASGRLDPAFQVPEKSWKAFGYATVLMTLAVYFTFNIKTQADAGLLTPLDSVSPRIGAFEARDEKAESIYKDPSAERDLTRRYVAPSGGTIEMYIAFRGRQRGDNRLRSPKLQFPYGWNYVWIEPGTIPSRGDVPINANWMLTQNNEARVLVLYWYQTRGKTIASETEKRFSQIRGALLERRTDAAIVRLAMPVIDADKIDQAKRSLAAFAADLYPELQRILPR